MDSRFWLRSASVASLACLAAARPPQTVHVSGTDYAFQAPAQIKAGETLFSFENRGSVRHEMSVALLKEGVDADSVMAGIIGGTPRRNFIDGQGAILIARPGDQPGPRLWINAQSGRTYLLLCTLKDTPDAKQHVMLGMIARLRVE